MKQELLHKYDTINNIKNKLLNKVAKYSQEELNKVPEYGGWSAGQVLFHVAFAESGTILVINKNLAENKVYLKGNFRSVLSNIFLVISLKLPLKFKAPKAVSKVPDSITFEEISNYFDKNTQDFKKILEELPNELENKLIFKHPRAGLFTIHQTLNFTREHYLHHESQLDRLLK